MISLDMVFLILAVGFTLLMTWGVGANDLGNVMSTTMGSKAISVRQAMIIAVIFEFAGAIFGGDSVTETMRDGIISAQQLNAHPEILIQGMLAILMACTIWMNYASYLGMPVSITNAIVGSLVGFGSAVLGIDAIHWQQVGYIAISWITSPMIAGISAYLLFVTIQRLILAKADPITQAKRYLPIYLFLIGIVLSFITVFKGLNHFGIHLHPALAFGVTIGCGLLITLLGKIYIRHCPIPAGKSRRRERFVVVERYFALLVALTACAMVFAHGSNDVAIAVGPMSVIYSLTAHPQGLFDGDNYPLWIVLLGCFGVLAGLIFYGRKVIETVGSSITALTPSRAFAATFAAASTVVISTSTGIPVSATQTLVGAVLGVGLARGIGALNLIVIRNIFMSWIITLPVSSVLTIVCFYLIKNVIAWL